MKKKKFNPMIILEMTFYLVAWYLAYRWFGRQGCKPMIILTLFGSGLIAQATRVSKEEGDKDGT